MQGATDRMLTAEDLMDRWFALIEQGASPAVEDWASGAPPEVVAEAQGRIDRIEETRRFVRDAMGEAPGEFDDFVPEGVLGRYEHPQPLAQGGMGLLCVAWDCELERTVAYKLMSPRYRDDPRAIARFRAEATITSGLDHPGIPKVLGLVEDWSGLPAYAMELIRAPSLRDALREEDEPGPTGHDGRRDVLLTHFIQACEIVAHGHQRGVLHRDIKPANILVGGLGATWLIDWGLAHAAEEAPDAPHAEAGTPFFRDPSRPAGTPPSEADDLFALGVTLALILAGDAPAVASPADLRPAPGTLPAVWAIAEKARHPDRAQRYDSAEAIADELRAALDDRPIAAYRDPWTTNLRRWASRHAAGLTVAGVSVVALCLMLFLASRVGMARREADRMKELEVEARIAGASAIGLAMAKQKLDGIAYVALSETLPGLMNQIEAATSDPSLDPKHALQLARDAIRGFQGVQSKLPRRKYAGFSADGEAKVSEVIQFLEARLRNHPGDRARRHSLGNLYLYKAVMLDDAGEMSASAVLARLRGEASWSAEDERRYNDVLANYERAGECLNDERSEEAYTGRGGAVAGRFQVLIKLGRYLDAREILASREFDPGTIDAASRSIFADALLKGAEMQQSHMPWSVPPRVDHPRAMREAERLAAIERVSDAAIFNAACAFSLASVDEKADTAERRRRADRAMDYLRRIAAHGYFRPKPTGLAVLLSSKDTIKELREDSALAPLRDRADYKELAAHPETPSPPKGK